MSVPPPGGDDSSEKTTVMSADQATLKKELEKAKDQPACLIIVRGTPQGQRYFLTQDEMFLGRDPSAAISLADQGISRKHAKVTRIDGKVSIEDLGSSNGIFINDKRVPANTSMPLAKEDMVRLGNSILKFLPAGELETLFIGNLSSAAHTDAMTRIFNKGYLMEALEAEFKRARALHTDFTLLYFDLDFFKKVNDGFGHDAGDFVLKEFTALIRTSHLRPKDIFARFGGEEFVVLLGNTTIKDALALGERIRAAVETHAFIYEGKKLPITTSMGVAELRADTESGLALLKAADKALYQAKQTGRNKVCLAS